MRILHLEDNAEDAELVGSILIGAGFVCETQRVETRSQFLAALQGARYDLILSDFSLPGYDGVAALDAVRETLPDLPFIFISGTIGEEKAIETLKKGATDYVLKDNLSRLPSAIRRALEEVEGRRARREAEAMVREQAALLELAREAILVEDLEGRITYWNPAAARLYGCTAGEAREQGVKELLYGGNPRVILEARTAVLAEGAWSGLLTQQTKAGAEILVQSHWTLIRDAASKPKSLLMINTDVTEVHRLEAKFLRAQRMESIGALAGGIAHDLNNVLSPILMAVEILRRKLVDAQGQRVLATVETSARRGADLVKQVLTFARGSEGERTLLQVGHLIREMEKIARETFPRSIRVQVDVPQGLWILSAEPTPLHQVLMNLCVNARDAMPEGGTLGLTGENVMLDEAQSRMNPGSRPGPHVLLTVTDTGTGIEGSHLDRIFDPFFTTKAGSGTGLGLSTSMSIVKTHEGFMDVESEPGRGTVFKVYLPALPGRQDLGPEAPFAPLPMGHGELVLVVDDETSVREIAREILEAQGYRCSTAADGREALSRYEEHRGDVQVVLTDMAMPNMDGAATIRALREADPQMKIIAASGLGSEPGLEDLSAPDVQAFLAKPYTSEKLLQTLAAVLKPGSSQA